VVSHGPPGLAAVFVAVAIYALALDGARRLALAIGLVSRPNPIVRSHRRPVPYLGGAGLVAAYALLLAAGSVVGGFHPGRDSILRAVAAFVIAGCGTWDDARPLAPGVRLLIEGTVAGAYVAAIGITSPSSWLVQVAILVLLTNAFNVIDVMDGLLPLVSALAVVSLLATPGVSPTPLGLELRIALIGLAVLFLFNRPPAHLFAGDGGSLPLGFLAGAWCLEARRIAPASTEFALLGAVAVPLLEVALLVVARVSRGASPLRGSPDHFALRLQDRLGWGKWHVLGVTALVGILFALAAPAGARLSAPWPAVVAAMALSGAAILWLALWRIPPLLPSATHATQQPLSLGAPRAERSDRSVQSPPG